MAAIDAPRSGLRNLLVLAACQGLWMTGGSMATTVASLAAVAIAGAHTDATLPQALQTLGMMLTSIPAARFMAHAGRRTGFMTGALSGAIGGCVAAAGIFWGNIALFWMGSLALGVHNGFAGFYRFAATEAVSENRRGKAISYVLAGGTLAAFLGPGLAVASRDLLLPAAFAGCYLVITGLAILAIITASTLRLPTAMPPPSARVATARTPLLKLIAKSGYRLALANAVGAYAPMTFLMVATPLGMQMCGLSFRSTALVIQWHVLAMYAPAFFVGHIIDRFGALPVMVVGSAAMVLSPLFALYGTGVPNFFLALMCLGLAWNLLFTGATRLLTAVVDPADKARGQGLNDFVVFGITALCSYSSGILLRTLGWQTLNVLVMVVCGTLFILNVSVLIGRRRIAVLPGPAGRPVDP